MSSDLDPIVDNWYRDAESGEVFEVVAVDEDAGLIEIQNYDGDIDELDSEAWRERTLELIEPPEDWSGPVDVEPEDLGYVDTTPSSNGNGSTLEDALESVESIPAPGSDEEE